MLLYAKIYFWVMIISCVINFSSLSNKKNIKENLYIIIYIISTIPFLIWLFRILF